MREMSPVSLERETRSPEETEAMGQEVAGGLRPGSVVLLHGDLGAGKSVFVRGLVRGLPGGAGLRVRSPTFVYIHHYPTWPPVHHVDLYRLPERFDPSELGLDELVGGGGITVIEWAQRLEEQHFPQATVVRIENLGGDLRRICVAPPN